MQRQYNNADSDNNHENGQSVYTSLISLGVCLKTGAFINPINDAVSKKASPVVNDDIDVSVKNLLEKLKGVSIKDRFNPQKVITNPHHLTTLDDVRSGKQLGIPVDLILAQRMNLNKYASKWVLVRITYCNDCHEFYAY